MTIAGILFSDMYILAYVHRFGIFLDFNFWSGEFLNENKNQKIS
jgi:hypothetical protein